MDIVAIIKEHPLPIIGGAAFLLLFTMRGSGASTNSSAVAASLQSQQIASDTNIKLASYESAASNARAGYADDMFRASVSASSANTISGNASMVQTLLGYFARQTNRQSLDNNLTISNNQIESSQQISKAKTAADLQSHLDDNNTKLNGLAIQYASIDKATTITAANLPAILQTQENIKRIDADTSLEQTRLNTEAARTNADAAKQSSTVSDIGKVADLVTSIFGF